MQRQPVAGDPNLINQYAQIHASEGYGNTSIKNLRLLRPEILIRRPRSILDYGCGQSRLANSLRLGYPADIHRYDPAIPEIAKKPEQVVDLLINIDVLEHVPEDKLDDVLADMKASCIDAIIIVDMAPAAKTLPDGQNAHCTLHPRDWWEERLSRHFGPLHPFPTLRSTRAGFMTWTRPAGQSTRYWMLRILETARHYLSRLGVTG